MDILILSPHVDDGVLGCGGTLAKYSHSDVNLHYVVFSPNSHEYEHSVLHNELVCSIHELGYDESVITYCDFETRYFPRDRQDILEYIYNLNETNHYDWIFTPSTFDVHQDHQTVTSELLRVYKRLNVSIFGYELILNQFSFNTAVFSGFETKELEAKMAAFRCFNSQMFRKHFDEELFRSTAKVRGAQMGVMYAEAFQAMRVVLDQIMNGV